MCIFFKDELPLEHEDSLKKIVEDWSKDDAETDHGFTWDDHMDHNWWSLENWLKEFEGLEIVE